jgi:hypothetical protein
MFPGRCWRYSHIRLEAKRTALEAIEAKPQPVTPDQKRENADTDEGTIQMIASRAGHKTGHNGDTLPSFWFKRQL